MLPAPGSDEARRAAGGSRPPALAPVDSLPMELTELAVLVVAGGAFRAPFLLLPSLRMFSRTWFGGGVELPDAERRAPAMVKRLDRRRVASSTVSRLASLGLLSRVVDSPPPPPPPMTDSRCISISRDVSFARLAASLVGGPCRRKKRSCPLITVRRSFLAVAKRWSSSMSSWPRPASLVAPVVASSRIPREAEVSPSCSTARARAMECCHSEK